MNLIVLVCCLIASVMGVGVPAKQSAPVTVEKELIGFSPETVREIKNLLGTFIIEDGRGGFFFPGIHTKAEVMGEMLCNDRRSFESFSPRIELRRTGDLVVQMALSFEDYAQCKRFMEYFKERFAKFNQFDIQEGGGGGIIEIGTKGVNKSTLMHYLSQSENVLNLLSATHYQPGPLMDVRSGLSIIVSDANGTIFPQPSKTLTFRQSHLKSSKANASILEYLEGGGFLVINSGNEPHRVGKKVLQGIPEDKKYLLKNIAIGVANGHILFYFNDEGTGVQEFVPYRKGAEKFIAEPKIRDVQLIYIGDNPMKSGNDWEGYASAGFDHAICVPHPKNVPHISAELKGKTIVGNDEATNKVFEAILKEAQAKSKLGEAIAFNSETVAKIISDAQA